MQQTFLGRNYIYWNWSVPLNQRWWTIGTCSIPKAWGQSKTKPNFLRVGPSKICMGKFAAVLCARPKSRIPFWGLLLECVPSQHTVYHTLSRRQAVEKLALTLERACAKSGLFLTWYKPLSMRPSPFRHMWICLAMINVLLPRKFGMCLTAIKVPFRASQCSVVQLLCTLKTNLYTEDFTWWIFNIVKSGIILTFFGLFC